MHQWRTLLLSHWYTQITKLKMAVLPSMLLSVVSAIAMGLSIPWLFPVYCIQRWATPFTFLLLNFIWKTLSPWLRNNSASQSLIATWHATQDIRFSQTALPTHSLAISPFPACSPMSLCVSSCRIWSTCWNISIAIAPSESWRTTLHGAYGPCIVQTFKCRVPAFCETCWPYNGKAL